MKLFPTIGYARALRRAQTLQPLHSQLAGTNTSFDGAAWNPDAFTLFASLDRAVADGYNADEMQIYVGNDSYTHRIQLQIDNDVPRTMRMRVGVNGVFSLSQDYTLNNRYLPTPQKYAITYDGTTFNLFMNGMKLMADDDIIPPTDIDGIAVGQDSKGTLTTSATDIDFRYYDQALNDTQARNLCRNTEMLEGVSYNANHIGIFCTGQSNIRGEYADDYSIANTGLVKNLKLSGVYENFTEPYQDYTGSLFGSLIFQTGTPNDTYMARALDALAGAGGGKIFYSIPASEGGTDQASDWKLYSAGSDADSLMNNLPMAACSRMLQGMQAGNVAAIVNHQGESDAIVETSESVYKDNFTDWMNELRAVRGSNILLVIVGLHQWHSGTGASETAWNNISNWREDLAATLPNAVFIDLSDITGKSGDEVHIDAVNNASVAARVAAAITAGI